MVRSAGGLEYRGMEVRVVRSAGGLEWRSGVRNNSSMYPLISGVSILVPSLVRQHCRCRSEEYWWQENGGAELLWLHQ